MSRTEKKFNQQQFLRRQILWFNNASSAPYFAERCELGRQNVDYEL